MAFDVKKFLSRWRKELVGLAVLVSAVLIFLLWQLGQVTLVQILTGLLVLAGLYWTSRRVQAAEDNVRVAEEGHITERFTKAIAQLGDKEMAIRLGGIYALERLARDSEKDHGPIMEVLTAYVREKAPRQEEDPPAPAKTPTTDIQAILTVIGRRKTTGNNRGNDRLDLSHTHLVGTHLSGANLSWAHLILANLSGAHLTGVDLRGADLILANLSMAHLIGVNLRGADLIGADLIGADLSMAHLIRADLTGAKNLTEEQVRSARSCFGAILPGYLPDSVKDLTKQPPPV